VKNATWLIGFVVAISATATAIYSVNAESPSQSGDGYRVAQRGGPPRGRGGPPSVETIFGRFDDNHPPAPNFE